MSRHGATTDTPTHAGTLMRWDTGSGRMTTVATGHGAVRRIHFAPPPSPELEFNPMARADLVARVSVLFASGLFGVWELDARSDLRPVRTAPPAAQSLRQLQHQQHGARASSSSNRRFACKCGGVAKHRHSVHSSVRRMLLAHDERAKQLHQHRGSVPKLGFVRACGAITGARQDCGLPLSIDACTAFTLYLCAAGTGHDGRRAEARPRDRHVMGAAAAPDRRRLRHCGGD